MKIKIEQLCLEGICDLGAEFTAEGTTLLYDDTEYRAAAILKCLVDPDVITAGGVFLEGLPLSDFYVKNLIPETFGYIFDDAIMLSNLSIQENLYLPYKIRFQEHKMGVFKDRIAEYLQLFDLDVDLGLRPAYLKPAVIKQLCFVRSLLLQPKVLLIDNPFYLLNRFERKNLMRVLTNLKTKIPMIIASTDEEFFPPFADNLLVFDPITQKFQKKVSIS